MLRLGVGHRAWLVDRRPAEPPCQALEQHGDLSIPRLLRRAEQHPLPAADLASGHDLDRNPVDLLRQLHARHPQPDQFSQMGNRHARAEEPDVDDDWGARGRRSPRRPSHRIGTSRTGAFESCPFEPHPFEPHLERRHAMPRGGKGPDTRFEERAEALGELLLRGAAECQGEIEGVAGLRQLPPRQRFEWLGSLSRELRQPADQQRAEARREALARQPHHPTDRIDPDFAELLERAAIQPQPCGRQRIDQALRGSPRDILRRLPRSGRLRRRLRRGEPMPARRHHHAPPPAAWRRLAGQRRQPIGVVGGGPGSSGGVGDRPAGMEAARGERPYGRARKSLFATEKACRGRDVEMEALRPLARV